MRVLLLSLLILSTVVHSGSGNIDKCYQNPMFGYFFRQSEYSTQNEKEDEILRSLTVATSQVFFSTLK